MSTHDRWSSSVFEITHCLALLKHNIIFVLQIKLTNFIFRCLGQFSLPSQTAYIVLWQWIVDMTTSHMTNLFVHCTRKSYTRETN